VKLKLNLKVKVKLIARVQVYRHCSEIDIAGLKDPRLHEQTIISALYNLGRLLDDDARHQVTYLLTLFSLLCILDRIWVEYLEQV